MEGMGTNLVPGERTKGSAKHFSPALHGNVTHLPLAHCAKPPLMQAFSPELHGAFALRLWNLRLRACASRPFWSVNEARFSAMGPAATRPARAKGRRTMLEKRMTS